jgi:hypothetical protein
MYLLSKIVGLTHEFIICSFLLAFGPCNVLMISPVRLVLCLLNL